MTPVNACRAAALALLFVVPAAKVNSGSVPPPLMTVGEVATPVIATLFVMTGSASPKVMTPLTEILILFLPAVAFAWAIATGKEPGPEMFAVVTLKVAA